MPVFNGESFLREALDSLLVQTYSNFELIISDNASTDITQSICLDYQKLDQRIRYIRQKENIGALANFQFVLNEAEGDYFTWAACDDKWDNLWVECLYEKIAGSNNSAVFGKLVQIDEKSQVISHPATMNSFDFSGNTLKRRISFFLEFEGKGKANLFYSLYKREMFKNVELIIYKQDYYALFDWLRRIQFVSVNDVHLYKRIHVMSEGAVKTKSLVQKILEVITLQTVFKNAAIARGYLAHTSGVESLIFTMLIPVKIMMSHIFYVRNFSKKLLDFKSTQ